MILSAVAKYVGNSQELGEGQMAQCGFCGKLPRGDNSLSRISKPQCEWAGE